MLVGSDVSGGSPVDNSGAEISGVEDISGIVVIGDKY